MELTFVFKEGIVSSLNSIVKEEERSRNRDETSSKDNKGKSLALELVSKSSGPPALSRMAQTIHTTLSAVGEPPLFDPLRLFIAHVEIEYGGFKRDQIQRVHDFQLEKEDTPCTMYIRLVRIAVEYGDVFTESQLVKIFLLTIDKRLLDLATPRIIPNYDGKTTLAQVFAKIGKCDRAPCNDDAMHIVS